MSIPGLDAEPEPEIRIAAPQTKTIELKKECEWRFEATLSRNVQVKILEGTAEIFGTELVLNKAYTFVGVKAAVFTWTGCTIELIADPGHLVSEYVAEETTMTEAINCHLALEGMRNRDVPPRVLVLGPEDSGKTTLSKTLTAYAIRSGRAPIVVGLDPREGLLSLPGTLTATVFKTLLEVESDAGGGWGTSPMSGPNGEIPVKMPLVYFFGGLDIGEKGGAMYRAQVTRLALAVQGRAKAPGQEEVAQSGIIIDTPGSLLSASQSPNYELIQHIVGEFSVNTIICLGSERVYNDMMRRFDKQPIGHETVNVVKIAKSEGVVSRDASYFHNVAETQIRSYFYGNPRVGAGVTLQPRQQQVDFDALPSVWRRISKGYQTDDEFLPGGVDDEYAPPESVSVPLPENQLFERMGSPVKAMSNCVLAVMNCPSETEAQEILRDSSCHGFLYVTDVDVEKRRISVLSPVAGRIPNRALVWGEALEGVLGVMT